MSEQKKIIKGTHSQGKRWESFLLPYLPMSQMRKIEAREGKGLAQGTKLVTVRVKSELHPLPPSPAS